MLLPTAAEWADWTDGLPQTGATPIHNNLPPGAVFGYAWSFQQINAFNIDSAGLDIELDYTWETDMGSITANYSANKKLRFDQQAGTGGPWIDYLNVDANTTFSSMEYLHTASLASRHENASVKLSWKHQNEYDGTNTSRTVTVDAINTFNLYGSYDFTSDGLLSDTQAFIQVNNLLDEEPPFLNTNGGYNSSDSSPLGRLTTIGFRKTF